MRKGLPIMKTAEVVAKNNIGLHGRPVTFFIETANCFKCAIWIEKDYDTNRRVNAKSMLGVLSLGIIGDIKFKIIAEGPDEEKAVSTLAALVNCGFQEPEVYEILRTVPLPYN